MEISRCNEFHDELIYYANENEEEGVEYRKANEYKNKITNKITNIRKIGRNARRV